MADEVDVEGAAVAEEEEEDALLWWLDVKPPPASADTLNQKEENSFNQNTSETTDEVTYLGQLAYTPLIL